ncbi:MAG: hypothetical protein D6725_10755 [Planctomycetota bacterium]|nr:MAG: hypothetical protein D6725_10755 [Planctomycetota bacterium]
MNDETSRSRSESRDVRRGGADSDTVFQRVPDAEAAWLAGPVPRDYWSYPAHRRRYMHWASGALGLRRYEDWYAVTTQRLRRLPGGASLLNVFGGSLYAAVQEAFPEYEFLPWLFRACPRSFWHAAENRRWYMRWLEGELGIVRPEQWYAVTHEDFKRHKGSGFLTCHHSSIPEAVREYRPEYPWCEWLFAKTPKGFWNRRANRVRYLEWLGQRLGFTRMEDWYGVRRTDFLRHHGGHLLRYYRGSPVRALRDCFPEYDWKEWLFGRVPTGFWDVPSNRVRYVVWLAGELGIRNVADWERVAVADLRRHGGAGFLTRHGSVADAIAECVAIWRSIGEGAEDHGQ